MLYVYVLGVGFVEGSFRGRLSRFGVVFVWSVCVCMIGYEFVCVCVSCVAAGFREWGGCWRVNSGRGAMREFFAFGKG